MLAAQLLPILAASGEEDRYKGLVTRRTAARHLGSSPWSAAGGPRWLGASSLEREVPPERAARRVRWRWLFGHQATNKCCGLRDCLRRGGGDAQGAAAVLRKNAGAAFTKKRRWRSPPSRARADAALCCSTALLCKITTQMTSWWSSTSSTSWWWWWWWWSVTRSWCSPSSQQSTQ